MKSDWAGKGDCISLHCRPPVHIRRITEVKGSEWDFFFFFGGGEGGEKHNWWHTNIARHSAPLVGVLGSALLALTCVNYVLSFTCII